MHTNGADRDRKTRPTRCPTWRLRLHRQRLRAGRLGGAGSTPRNRGGPPSLARRFPASEVPLGRSLVQRRPNPPGARLGVGGVADAWRGDPSTALRVVGLCLRHAPLLVPDPTWVLRVPTEDGGKAAVRHPEGGGFARHLLHRLRISAVHSSSEPGRPDLVNREGEPPFGVNPSGSALGVG